MSSGETATVCVCRRPDGFVGACGSAIEGLRVVVPDGVAFGTGEFGFREFGFDMMRVMEGCEPIVGILWR